MTIRNNEAIATLELLANDYNLYNVTFRYSETTFCSNIVLADSEEDIERAYSEYKDIIISHISRLTARADIQRKQKPLVIA